MNRIMVLGCCGAGKSTLAKKLHRKTGLELIHLDQHYWNADWVETDDEKWPAIVEQLAAKENWIIDGNYSSTFDVRLKRADTIIYLDYPTWRCLWRVSKRIWENNGITRSDMAEGCPERFDWEFIHYVATFNLRKRKGLLKKINSYQKEKSIHIFQNDKEAQQFLDNLT